MSSSTFANIVIVVLLFAAGFFLYNWFQSRKTDPKTSKPDTDKDTDKKTEVVETKAPSPPEPAPEPQIKPQVQQATFNIADNVELRVTVETIVAEKSAKGKKTKIIKPKIRVSGFEGYAGVSNSSFWRGISAAFSWMRERLTDWPYSWSQSVFVISLMLYLIIRLIGLTEYPIYFFTDEAIQTNLAADFIRDGLKNHDGEFLPTFFRNVDRFNLSLSVYAQVIPYLFFGKSVFVTRAVSVLFSLMGAYWIGLTLRDIFKIKLWWSGVLLLSITPAWFLHSRTAFETVMMASFYAGFLYYYLSYRYLDPKKLYLALSLGALAFYTYSPGRVVVVVTGLLFLISDLRYHLNNKQVAMRGLGVLGLLILPFLRFNIAHSSAGIDQLRLMGSYSIQSIPINEKLLIFWKEYLFGINPGYWFFDITRDFNRHLMGDYGHLLPITMPLGIVGFIVVLKSLSSSSAHRAILIALLAAPTGAALVTIGITRVLVFVIPATLLFSLGLESIANWLMGRGLSPKVLSYGTFILLAASNIGFARNALVNGPFWSSDYGMGGMQYGATQLFGTIKKYMDENPTTELIVTPNWANGGGILADFFFPKGRPFAMGSIHGYIDWQNPINDQTVFVAIPSEHDLMKESGKFKDITIKKTINYPDGNPGFYFITLSYVDSVEDIFAAEIAERSKPIEAVIDLDGDEVRVLHSLLDIGEIKNLFDGDEFSLTRTMEANPFVVELAFPEARTISGITAITGAENIRLEIIITLPGGIETITYSYSYEGSVESPEFNFSFPETHQVENIRLEFWDLTEEIPAHIHVWEIIFEE